MRTGRIPDMIPGLSRFQQIVLHQGWVEGYFRDNLKKYGGAEVEFSTMPGSMGIDELKVDDNDAYPVRVVLRHLKEGASAPEQFGHKVLNELFRSNLATDAEEDNALAEDAAKEGTEIVNCKYVLGCDGAHSWVRRQLGFEMIGEHTDYVWGVLDVVPITNFPDIRNRCAIHSAESGSVMIIPREGALVRFYIQLSEIERDADGRVDRSKITPGMILKACQKIMAPYTVTYEEIQWFTAYQIGQRIVDDFSSHNRVFITGDAAHTHSPKAGQGMNTSMMDTYNLAWKVGSVCQGILDRSALSTYGYERSAVARDLINFDREFAKMFSGKPAKDAADEAGVSLEEFKKVFEQSHLFASGVSIDYKSSNLIAKAAPEQADPHSPVQPAVVKSKQHLATGIPVGQRFNSFQVMNQADARPWQLQDLMKSDSRWRVTVFAGDVRDAEQKARIEKLAAHLDKPDSLIHRYTPADRKRDGVFHVLTVHSAPRVEVELHDFPAALRPEHDYWSVYVDDMSHHEGHGHAYENYGVDARRGCIVVSRPDQYVALVCELEDTDLIEKFFAACMVPQKK